MPFGRPSHVRALVRGGAAAFSTLAAGDSVTYLSLVLRHVGDCSGALVEKVGGCLLGEPWAGLVGIILNAKAAWGECVIQHRATDVRPTKPRSLLAAFSLAANYCCGSSSREHRNATHRNATAASVIVVVVRSGSSSVFQSPPTHPHTHTPPSLRTFEIDSMAACHPSPTASPS